MRKPHRFEHLQKQLEAIRKPQALRTTPVRQWLALDVLHGQVWATTGVDSRLVEARDIGMLEAREDVALQRKAQREILPQLPEQRQLEGYVALKCAVCTPGQPYLCHASGAERSKQY